jgi:hypothetical protein
LMHEGAKFDVVYLLAYYPQGTKHLEFDVPVRRMLGTYQVGVSVPHTGYFVW